jgi:head-tail adaptor
MSKRIKIAETKETTLAVPNADEEVKVHKQRKTVKAPAKNEGSRKSSRSKKEVVSYDMEALISSTIDMAQSPAKNPMLASKYDGNQDIKGWIMSEKLDGVR